MITEAKIKAASPDTILAELREDNVIIVAVKGAADDWAAYCFMFDVDEDLTASMGGHEPVLVAMPWIKEKCTRARYVVRHGAKLSMAQVVVTLCTSAAAQDMYRR